MNANERRRTGPAVLNRVLGYMLHYYKYLFILVIGCILVSAVCTVVGATFPQTLIDEYIEPMLSTGSRDFTGLAQDIKQLVCIMGAGVIASFGYNRIMVNVSQGTLRHLRDDLFHKMESLPIKYFDTHAHGDIMSVYTNDVDTLRQLLSQSIPQLINSSFTMVATLITMIIMSPALTVVSVLAAIAMFTVTKNFSRLSGKYFVKQQRALGEVDGFIEEMLDGQKVVKVFCHEEAAKADFHKVLRQSANLANRYSNLLMPINMNIGWLSYALVAIVGAILAINGMAGVTLGTVITFVGLHKSFTNPIAQVSMQINFVVTAAAGAQRVFDLMDQRTRAMWSWSTPGRTRRAVCMRAPSAPTCGPGNTPTGRRAPSPTPGWRAAWSLRTWTSAMTRTSWSSTTSACGPSRARRSPSWAPPARARPPSPT